MVVRRRDLALAVDDLTMAFLNKTVLDGVSFELPVGSAMGLIGHNGSGKSTLIKILAGRYVPVRGHVQVYGEVLAFGKPQSGERLGLRFVHQDLALQENMSVLENFALGWRFAQSGAKTIKWQVLEERLEMVLAVLGRGLQPMTDVKSLSAVDRTILAIARAIAPAIVDQRRGVLILDEATASLETTEVDVVFKAVRELLASGHSAIFVSHHLKEVLELCATVVALRSGAVVATRARATTDEADLLKAMFGSSDGDDKSGVVVARATDYRAADAFGTGSQATVSGLTDGGGTVAVNANSSLTADSVLAVRGLWSTYLRGVDIELRHGECVLAVGLAGSGREELVQVIGGLVEGHADEVTIEDERVRSITAPHMVRAGVVLVPGNRLRGSAVPQFCVRENLTLAVVGNLGRRFGTLNRKREVQWAQEDIIRFDVRPPEAEHAFLTLSGGNKQKVILARALRGAPKVLLLDEPTGGIDPATVLAVVDILRTARDRGISLLVALTDYEDLLGIADRVLVLSKGHLAGEVRPKDYADNGMWEIQRLASGGSR